MSPQNQKKTRFSTFLILDFSDIKVSNIETSKLEFFRTAAIESRPRGRPRVGVRVFGGNVLDELINKIFIFIYV